MKIVAMSFVTLISAVLLSIATSGLSQNGDFNFVGVSLTTSAVNTSGKRNDNFKDDIFDAEPGRVFDQSSFVATVLDSKYADESLCTPIFSQYVEYVPGITMPTRVLLHSFVKSVGGVFNFGKKGRVQCSLQGKYLDRGVVTGQGSGVDAETIMPTLPVYLLLERQNRSLVTASVPLTLLEYIIKRRVTDSLKLPQGFTLSILNARFDAYMSESPNLAFYADVDVSGPIGARCEFTIRFAIPAARVKDIAVQDLGTDVNCRSGSLIGELANLNTRITSYIRQAITEGAGKQLPKAEIADWSKQDPDLADFLSNAFVQGSYCDWKGRQSLCLRIGWADKGAIASYEAALLARVPAPSTPADAGAAKLKLDAFREIALEKHRANANGVAYPAALNADGSFSDRDMAMFGGLLCRSGEPEGCTLLQHAWQDGRFWRSPRLIGEQETDDTSSFSGDQTKGVLSYFIATRDDRRLKAFLDYIKSKPTQVPGAELPLVTGYSDCPNYYPNFTCLIGDDAWLALTLLASKLGATSELPQDLPSIQAQYNFSYDALVWSALFVNTGYRLHLIGNTIWILSSLGQADPRLKTAAAILATRQPKNPFFLYLHLGRDAQVEAIADSKCEFPIVHRDFSDWAWQRSETEEAWKRSMVWDCVFIYRLLAGDAPN